MVSEYTTIRIKKSVKKALDSMTFKNESYDKTIYDLIQERNIHKSLEEDFLKELKKVKYVDYEEIKW